MEEECKGCNNFSMCNKCMNGEQWAFIEEKGSEELENKIQDFFDRWMEDSEYNQAVMPNFCCASLEDCKNISRHFAKWQKSRLWKPADGDDLPEYEREVIVLTQHYPLEGSEYAVYFAHRPNPEGWDAKSLTTGEVEHYTPKTYDKGGWNIPNVVLWLDLDIPQL